MLTRRRTLGYDAEFMELIYQLRYAEATLGIGKTGH
jgi:hypothetical protein